MPDHRLGKALGLFRATALPLVLLLGIAATATAGPGDTSLVVTTRPGTTAAEGSEGQVMSADGRFVVFRSSSPNLVPKDRNLQDDVFLFDRTTNKTARITNLHNCSAPENMQFRVDDVSIDNEGRLLLWSVVEFCDDEDEDFTAALVLYDRATKSRRVLRSGLGHDYVSARFSGDSHFVVFVDLNFGGDPDVWLYELATDQVVKITNGSGTPSTASINSDGSVVVFASDGILTPADNNGVSDVFLYRRATGSIERISESTSGAQGDGASSEPVVSADGRFVVYSSLASNLVSGDTNGVSDVFIYNVQTAATARVSKATSNAQLDGASFEPSVSADGRYVAFSSRAANAVAGDTNNVADIFLRDRTGATTTRLVTTSTGEQANGAAREPAISANGRFVAFASAASNVVTNDRNRVGDIFLLDRDTGEVLLATRAAVPVAGLPAGPGALSASGSQIAFESTSPSLVANDTNGTSDVFVRDYPAGAILRVSRPTDAAQANGASGTPCISADGNSVGFWSRASNFGADDEKDEDIFVRNRAAATTVLASVSSAGTQLDFVERGCDLSGNGALALFMSGDPSVIPGDDDHSLDIFIRNVVNGTTEVGNVGPDGQRIFPAFGPVAISANGRYVAFPTHENLDPADTEFDEDVYLRDRQQDVVERISVPIAGQAACCHPHIQIGGVSANGRFVVFRSAADNLVPGDTNARADIFVRDRELGITRLASVIPPLERPVWNVSFPTISDDGRFVAFMASTGATTPVIVPFSNEIFYRDMRQEVTVRASQSSAGVPANSYAYAPEISGNGRFILFRSPAANLVPEPLAGETLFLHERQTAAPTFSAAPAGLSFGPVAVGAASPPMSVKISNTGRLPIAIASFGMAGSNPGQFKRANDCPAQIEVGAHCTVSVTFKPTTTGAKSAELTITPVVGAVKSVALSGTGS
jgi:Tol biopolymer transport system component